MVNTCQFIECDRNVHAKDLCTAHYRQMLAGKALTPIKKNSGWSPAFRGLKRNDPNKFWRLTEQQGECLIWQGTKYPTGYGEFIQGNQNHMAHRRAYEMSVGPIPDGQLIDHICHNRACVNPEHLRLASAKQNQENLGVLHSTNTSGYRGVTQQGNRWVAYLTHNRQYIHVGRYGSKEEAAEAVRLKRNELFTHNDLDRVA